MSRTVLTTMLLLSILASFLLIPDAVVAQQGESPGAQVFEVDSFTYRASFKLGDGTEAMQIRARFTMYYFYKHHQPTVNEHHLSAVVGFYFGKTLLGRPLVSAAETNSIAFYPWWYDSQGWKHDLLMETPLVSVAGAIDDSVMESGMILVDSEAVSQIIPGFGGTFVIDGLRFDMDDASVQVVTEGIIQIRLEKQYNDFEPEIATLSGADNLSYTSDPSIITISMTGSAPLIMWVDYVLGLSLIGLGVLAVALIALHMTGRVTLPLGRIRQAMIRLHRLAIDSRSR